MDLILPRMRGVECLRGLREKWPRLQVLVFTQFDHNELVFEALKAGAAGYLLKQTPPAQLLEAIRAVHAGGSMMTPSVARKIFQYFQQLPGEGAHAPTLSPRETEVLHLARKGLTYQRIADQLHIDFNTVRTHFRNIYLKLEVNSRGEAVAKYFRLE